MLRAFIRYYNSTDGIYERKLMYEAAKANNCFVVLLKHAEKTIFFRHIVSDKDYLKIDGFVYKERQLIPINIPILPA